MKAGNYEDKHKETLFKVKLKQEGRTENVNTQQVNISHYKYKE